jgi:hypothetical protein
MNRFIVSPVRNQSDVGQGTHAKGLAPAFISSCHSWTEATGGEGEGDDVSHPFRSLSHPEPPVVGSCITMDQEEKFTITDPAEEQLGSGAHEYLAREWSALHLGQRMQL